MDFDNLGETRQRAATMAPGAKAAGAGSAGDVSFA